MSDQKKAAAKAAIKKPLTIGQIKQRTKDCHVSSTVRVKLRLPTVFGQLMVAEADIEAVICHMQDEGQADHIELVLGEIRRG